MRWWVVMVAGLTGCVAPVEGVDFDVDAGGVGGGAVLIPIVEPPPAVPVVVVEPEVETVSVDVGVAEVVFEEEGRACRCYRCWRPLRRGTLLGGRCKCPDGYDVRRGICCRLPLRRDPVLDVW